MQIKDLDSILDAALDELDDNDESSGSIESDAHGQTTPSAKLTTTTTTTTTAAAALGVPYSLDFLSKYEHETSVKSRRSFNKNSKNAPVYGPEPPPPIDYDTAAALLNDESVQKEMEQLEKELEKFGFGDGEDFHELFQRMNQAFPGVDKELGDGMEFDDAMKNMLRMAINNGGRLDDRDASSHDDMETPSSLPSAAARSSIQSMNKTPSSAMASTSTNDNPKKSLHKQGNNAPTKQTTLPKNVDAEKNVDESIHRLLRGINNASSSSSGRDSNAQHPFPPPPLPPGMENFDPSQFEQFSEEIMSTLMNEFEQMGHKRDSNAVVDNVMKQLLDRDIMYEPMKEVCTRFPKYLAEHKDRLSPEEYTRYGTQYQYFQRIVHVYETEPNNFDRLMELMQDIQEYGQPPVEIIQELAPELEFDAEGMPMFNTGEGRGGGGLPPFFPGSMRGNEQCCIS